MRQAALLIFCLFLLVYVLPLGSRPMVVPDESRYSEIPREMVASGDWVVPRLNGLRYFEKPVLGYWLVAASIKLFGENAFATRLSSALAAGLSALLVYLMVRRGGGERVFALLSAAVLLTSMMFFGLGVYNVLDGPVSFFLTATLAFFFFAYTAPDRRAQALWLLAAGAACGFAFMTKGFLAFAVAGAAITPFLLWERRWKSLFTLPWLPALAALIVSIPWCIAIHLREPDYWHYFFWIEHIRRFTSETPQHPEPFWYFIPVVLAAVLPWTFLLPAAGLGLRRARPFSPLLRYATTAFLGPFLFFSASAGKLATYILPCLPPLAILIAAGISGCLDHPRARSFRAGAWISALVAAILAVGIVLVQNTDISGVTKPFMEQESWKWMLIGLAFGIWAISAALSALARTRGDKLILYALSPVMVMFSVHFVMPEAFVARKAPAAFIRQYKDRVMSESVIATDNNLVHLVCWIFQRNDVYLLQSEGELKYGLGYEDSRHRLLDVAGFNELIRRHAPLQEPVVLIAEQRDLDKYWGAHIPTPEFKAANEKFFIATYLTPLR